MFSSQTGIEAKYVVLLTSGTPPTRVLTVNNPQLAASNIAMQKASVKELKQYECYLLRLKKSMCTMTGVDVRNPTSHHRSKLNFKNRSTSILKQKNYKLTVVKLKKKAEKLVKEAEPI